MFQKAWIHMHRVWGMQQLQNFNIFRKSLLSAYSLNERGFLRNQFISRVDLVRFMFYIIYEIKHFPYAHFHALVYQES